MCPAAPPPPGTYPPGRSAHNFIDLFHWCRSINGGPACSCNQFTGLPECGWDGPNRGMSFDFELMTAAYSCLNCLCVDMRRPGLHQTIPGNTFPLGAEHRLGMLPMRSGMPSTNVDIPQAQEQRTLGRGHRFGPSREAHYSEGVQVPRGHVNGGTPGITVTTGMDVQYGPAVLGLSTVTTGLGYMNSRSRVGGFVTNSDPIPANVHRVKGALARSKSVQSSFGAGPSNPGSRVGFRTGTHKIEPAQRPAIRIKTNPVRQEKNTASPAGSATDGFPEWGAKAQRTTQRYPRVGVSRAQPVQSFETLSRENPHQKISDAMLGTMHRVRMSGSRNQQRVDWLRVPTIDGGGGILSNIESTSSRNEPNGSMDID